MCKTTNQSSKIHNFSIPHRPQLNIHFQCKHQLVTILNLRTAIEDSSRQQATSTTNPASFSGHSSSSSPVSPSSPLPLHQQQSSAPSGGSTPSSSIASNTHTPSMWNWWRTVHDVWCVPFYKQKKIQKEIFFACSLY